MNSRPGIQLEGPTPRIGLFYSLGPHFLRSVQRLKASYPAATITVLLPPEYPLSEKERAFIDTVVETELPHYSPRNAGPCFRLLRQIRDQRFDLFVVLFASTQLRILSSLSGAKQRACCLPQGHLVPLKAGLLSVVAGEGLRRVWGRLAYAGIWLAIRLFPVRTRG